MPGGLTPDFAFQVYTPSTATHSGQVLHVFRPDALLWGPVCPVVMFVNNSGFTSTSLQTSILNGTLGHLSRLLRAGWCVVSLQTTITNNPTTPGGATIIGGRGLLMRPDNAAYGTNAFLEKDVQLAVQYLRRNAARFGINPDAIFTDGRSGGAQGALWATIAPNCAGATGFFSGPSTRPTGCIIRAFTGAWWRAATLASSFDLAVAVHHPYASAASTGGTWTEASKRLSKTGAFTYAIAGDSVSVTGGTGATVAIYTIESVPSANVAVLTTSIGVGADGQTDIAFTAGSFDLTTAAGTKVASSMSAGVQISTAHLTATSPLAIGFNPSQTWYDSTVTTRQTAIRQTNQAVRIYSFASENADSPLVGTAAIDDGSDTAYTGNYSTAFMTQGHDPWNSYALREALLELGVDFSDAYYTSRFVVTSDLDTYAQATLTGGSTIAADAAIDEEDSSDPDDPLQADIFMWAQTQYGLIAAQNYKAGDSMNAVNAVLGK